MPYTLNELGMRVYTDTQYPKEDTIVVEGLTYNKDDNMWYGTNAQRVAANVAKFSETSKVYTVDTKYIYILYSGAWQLM